VLLSSHLLGEVQQVCDRVGVVSRGRLVAQTSVGELRGAGCLEVLADPVELAVRRSRELLGEDRVRYDGTRLDLDVPPEDAARINAELVAAGVAVHGVRWREPDLEEVFLELTGGVSHVG